MLVCVSRHFSKLRLQLIQDTHQLYIPLNNMILSLLLWLFTQLMNRFNAALLYFSETRATQ
ncbi:hypothetical protein DXX92_08805 [Thalassotalea euphylliae]|uniref:Uncharacterized protein n=1 Tax=Thalassotalea euphylliae TaxID=1655234 RepID=A0A3E0UI53_9GAMM|nr:hypothetical protein DXX92_08805 [Thalassotalea euphylliae]